MLVLNNGHLNVEAFCEPNRKFLEEKGLINKHTSDFSLSGLSIDAKREIIAHLIEGEVLNTQEAKAKYQKEKNKARGITLFLCSAATLLGTGFAFASVLLPSMVLLFTGPILLLSFAIVGITQLCLSFKVNHFKANAARAINILEQLKGIDIDTEWEMLTEFKRDIQEIKDAIREGSNKVDSLEGKTVQHASQILARLGIFPTVSIPIAHVDSANELSSKEAMSSSPMHS